MSSGWPCIQGPSTFKYSQELLGLHVEGATTLNTELLPRPSFTLANDGAGCLLAEQNYGQYLFSPGYVKAQLNLSRKEYDPEGGKRWPI